MTVCYPSLSTALPSVRSKVFELEPILLSDKIGGLVESTFQSAGPISQHMALEDTLALPVYALSRGNACQIKNYSLFILRNI